MRENALLSPHRGPQRPVNDHDGRITTDAPGVMWGTDAAVIPTVEDGNIALFVVVEHWNECLPQPCSDQARMARRTRPNKGGRVTASCVQKTWGGTGSGLCGGSERSGSRHRAAGD